MFRMCLVMMLCWILLVLFVIEIVGVEIKILVMMLFFVDLGFVSSLLMLEIIVWMWFVWWVMMLVVSLLMDFFGMICVVFVLCFVLVFLEVRCVLRVRLKRWVIFWCIVGLVMVFVVCVLLNMRLMCFLCCGY